MFSKFSVLSKLCKHSHFNFKHYGLLHSISRFYYLPTRRLSGRNANELLVLHEHTNITNCCSSNLLDPALKRNNFVRFIRNMNSIGKDGDDGSKSNPNQKSDGKKKVIILKRWKVNRMKNVKVKCKRCKKLHVKKTEVEKPISDNNIILKKDLNIVKDFNIIKAEPALVTNDEGISQSHLPTKKLHVEFMESQNRKDFNLNKDQPNNALHKRPNVIDIKVLPVNVSDEKPSLKLFQMVAKNSFSELQQKPPESSIKNNENLPMLTDAKKPASGSSSELAQNKINKNIPHEMKAKSLPDLTFQFQIKQNKSPPPSGKLNKFINAKNDTVRTDRELKMNFSKPDILIEERKFSNAKELKEDALIKANAKDFEHQKSNVKGSTCKNSDLLKVNFSNQNILHQEQTSLEQDSSIGNTKEIRILYQARPKKKIAKTKYKKTLKRIPNAKVEQKNSSGGMAEQTKEFYAENSEANLKETASKALQRKKNRVKWLKLKKNKANLNMFANPLVKKLETSEAKDSTFKINNKKEEPSYNKSTLYPTASEDFSNTKTKSFVKEMGEAIGKISKSMLNSKQKSDKLKQAKSVLYPTQVSDKLTKSKSALNPSKKSEDTSSLKTNKETEFLPNIVNTTAFKTAAVRHELKTNTSIGKTGKKLGVTNLTEQLPQNYVKKTMKEDIKKTGTKDTEKGSETKKIAVQSSTLNKHSIDDFQPPTHWPKNMFGEYMSPEKLKEIKEKLKFINEHALASGSGLKKKKNPNRQGSTDVKTDKKTKFKQYGKGAGNRGGDSRGDDGGDNINQRGAMAEKAAPSRFWRNLSLSVLPILIGVTVYLFSNIEALDMFRRMRLTPTRDPFDMKVLPAFYETALESETLSRESDEETIDENDADSEAVEIESAKDSETNEIFEDHRLDDA